MKTAYEYLLADGNRGEVAFTEESELRDFLHEHKKEIDSMTVTLDDGRRFTYEKARGWEELDSPF